MTHIYGVIILGIILTSCNESTFSQSPVSEVENSPENPVNTGDQVKVTVKKPSAPDSQIFSFVASEEKSTNFQITLDDNKLMSSFNLVNNYSNREDRHQQLTRLPVTDMQQQGNPGTSYNEVFDQVASLGVLDVLVVIDNSGSMREEQANLATKLNQLLSSLTETDWRIALTTTDPNDSCIHQIITKGDADASQKFSNGINVGTSGSGREQGIRRAVDGLKNCDQSPTWRRNEASIAVLIVSDEDNCSSNGFDCRGSDWDNPQYLIDYVEKTLGRTVGKDAGFYGIFSDPSDQCNTAYNHAPQYKTLVTYNAGSQKNYGDICDNDYSDTLNQISTNITKILKSQWVLQAVPDTGSITVRVQAPGQAMIDIPSTDYTINDKTLTFNDGKEPADQSKIYVDYTTGQTPTFQSMTLSETPAPNTLSISINGAVQSNSTYSLNGKVVTFNTKPVGNSTVQANYRKNTALLTSFDVSGTPRNQQIQVLVNNVQTSNFSYDSVNKKVTLNDPPSDGQDIVFQYENNDGPKLSYDLVIAGQNPRDFKLFDDQTEVVFSISGTQITINANDHQENKTLVLKYEADKTEEQSFVIPQQPVENTLEVLSSTSNCSLGDGFSFSGNTIISTCIVQDLTQFDISYSYIAIKKDYTLSSISAPESGIWKVFVDGETYTNYSRNGKTITINGDIPLGSKVEIHYEFAS